MSLRARIGDGWRVLALLALLAVLLPAPSARAATEPEICAPAVVSVSSTTNCLRPFRAASPGTMWGTDPSGAAIRIPQPVAEVTAPMRLTAQISQLNDVMIRATYTMNLQRTLPYGECGDEDLVPDDEHGSRPTNDAPCAAMPGFDTIRWFAKYGTTATFISPGADPPNVTSDREHCAKFNPPQCVGSAADLYQPRSQDPEQVSGYNEYHIIDAGDLGLPGSIMPACANDGINNGPGGVSAAEFRCYPKVRLTWPSVSSGVARIDIDLPRSVVNADKYVLFTVPEFANLSDYFWYQAAPGSFSLSGWVRSYADSQYDVALKIPKQSQGLPTASCTAALLPGTNGGVRFASHSTDPSGVEPLAMWRSLSLDLPAGDDGTRVGTRADFRYDRPGDHKVELTAMGADGPTTTTCQFTVPGPALAASISYVSPSGEEDAPPFKLGNDAPVKVTISATRPTGAVGTISHISFASGQPFGGIVKQTGTPGGSVTTLAGGPGPAPAPFNLAAGRSRSFYTTINALSIGAFGVSTRVEDGEINYTSSTIPTPGRASATATNAGQFGDGVEVSVTLTPPAPENPQVEGDDVTDVPDPVDLEAKLTVKNTSQQTITHLRVDSVAISSSVETAGAGTAFLAAVQAPRAIGPIDVTDQLPAGGLEHDQSVTIGINTARDPFVFHVLDDVKAKVKASVTASTGADITAGNVFLDSATKKWKLDPEYRVAVTYEQSRPDPENEPLLPAGSEISIRGTVKNLSGTDTLTVGPLYPQLVGNAIGQSFAWDTNCGDIDDFQPVEPKELAPNQVVHWTLCVATGRSDAKAASHPTDRTGGFGHADEPNGGTRARLFFSPWATYVDEEGETHRVQPADFKVERDTLTAWEDASTSGADTAGAQAQIHIDDSVPIPATNGLVTIGAFGAGAVKGVVNGAVGLLTLPSLLLYGTYTSVAATIEFETQAWYAMDTGEKQAFMNDVAPRIYAQLVANYDYAQSSYATMRPQIDAAVYQFLLEQQEEWYVGDSYKVAEFYGDAFGQTLDTGAVAGRILRIGSPIIARAMVASPMVRRALERADDLRRARYEAQQLPKVIAATEHLDPKVRFEKIGEALYEIESGTHLTPDDVARLFSISTEEFDELQAIADELNILMTVRSRHGSSLTWIREGAELKPEALKIKSISELDARLGYRFEDIGSLVFRKPLPLELYEQELLHNPAARLQDFVEDYVDSLIGGPLKPTSLPQGAHDAGAILDDIVLQPSQRAEAIERLGLKIEEWQKFEKKYKSWVDMADDAPVGTVATGWLDRTFDGVGNAVSQDAMKVNAENRLFRMTKIADAQGVESYELFLWNPQRGRFGRVTGDIDAIAFTHVDGTPLTELEHAQVLLRTRGSSRLKAPHAESATFVGKPGAQHDGVAFVKSQFKEKVVDGQKIMEGALQIAPGGRAAGRAPRLVRLNDDPNHSLWKSPFDYKLHWDGGFNDVGTGAATPGAIPPLVTGAKWTDIQTAPKGVAIEPGAQPRSIASAAQANGEPTLGICTVNFSTAPGTSAYVLLPNGKVGRVVGGANGTPASVVVDETITASCRNPDNAGQVVTMMPATITTTSIVAGTTEVPIADISVGRDARGGLAIGAQVLIGAGTDHAETRTVVGFGSIILDRPLTYAHSDREAIVVVQAAPRTWDPPVVDTPAPVVDTPAPIVQTPAPVDPAPVAKLKPSAKKAPTVAGKFVVGKSVTCKPGTWSGTAPIKYAFAWQRKVGRKWTAIKGAAKAAYKIARVDAGKQVRCVVTAANAAGKASATSKPAAVARVAAARR